MNRKFNLVELFSGIGSQAKALENIGVEANVVATCEWDIHALVAYDAIHYDSFILDNVLKMTKEELLKKLSIYNLSNNGKTAMQFKVLKSYSKEALMRIYSAILRTKNAVDVTELNGKNLNMGIDILTYSFPCQDLSNVGAFHGYNKGIDKNSGSRSSLLWQVGRILLDMKKASNSLPRFLVLENVPALLSNRHKGNFEKWQKDLKRLGYHNKVYLLNAANYGIPQNRPRLIMLSTLLPKQSKDRADAKKKLDDYYCSHDISSPAYYSSIPLNGKNMKNLLRTDYGDSKLWQEALECQPNDTVSRRAIWEQNPQLIDEEGNMPYEIVRTLTTKQDRNPNSGNLYFDYEGNTKSKFRYLTPRECFLFMGFDENDFEGIIEKNPIVHKGTNLFTRDKLIRMAGNSIPVNLLEQVFIQLVDIDEKIASKWI